MGGEQPHAVAIAMGGALIGAVLMELGAGEGGNLGLQQVLETAANDLRDQGATMGAGHGLCSVWW